MVFATNYTQQKYGRRIETATSQKENPSLRPVQLCTSHKLTTVTGVSPPIQSTGITHQQCMASKHSNADQILSKWGKSKGCHVATTPHGWERGAYSWTPSWITSLTFNHQHQPSSTSHSSSSLPVIFTISNHQLSTMLMNHKLNHFWSTH